MSDKMRRCLIGILLLVFCVSAVAFGKSLWSYHEGDQIYESALGFVEVEETNEVTDLDIEADDSEKEEKKKSSVAAVSTVKRTHSNIDFKGLQAINGDIFGWIQIFGTQVDYPLLDADDSQYYLNHAYDHRRSAYGSIFLEPRNSQKMNDRHVIIYGHNMVNRSMFGSLLNYKKQSYADAHNKITICMPGKDLVYQVFSVYTADIDSPNYRLNFAGDASFEEMISYMKKHSVISSNITPHVGDQILTLSTCTSTGSKSKRFVVNAVLVNGDYKPATTQKIEVQPEIEEEVMSDDQNDKVDEIFVPIEQVEEDLAQSIEIDIENE